MDLLIQRMETYATDLEGVAQEKTRAFLEEQKKTDEYVPNSGFLSLMLIISLYTVFVSLQIT